MQLKTVFPIALLALLAACSRSSNPDAHPLSPNLLEGPAVTESGLQYKAETAIMESFPVQLATTVKVVNQTNKPATLQIANGCPVLLRAYRTPERTGEPAWDQSKNIACTMALLIVDIEPGESRSFTIRTNAREILGDSLPNGRYYLSALLNKTDTPIILEAGDVDLAQ